MELLLKQMEEEDKQEKIEEDTDEEDDVSQMYYGENCTCSKNSMCKSSKCLCFLRTQKCTQECLLGALAPHHRHALVIGCIGLIDYGTHYFILLLK